MTKLIVFVADPGDPRHGEITVLGSTSEAERLLETFLEAGFDRERIRVFAGVEMDARVTQRPVVALVADGQGGSTDGGDSPVVEAEDEDAAPDADTGAEEEPAREGASSLFGRLRTQPVEMMPELLH